MKQILAVIAVIMIISAVGFAGYWIGRTDAPPVPTRNELASAIAQRTSSVSDPAVSPITPVMKNAARSIRTQVINSSTPSTQLVQKTDAPPKNPERPSQSAKTTDTNTSTPIKTPQEAISLFTDDDPSQVFQPESVRYHAAVQAEPVDPDWGLEAQADLQSFFSAELAQNDAYVTAQCGTDLCELDVVAAGNDSHAFSNALRDLKQQTWWTGLGFDQETGIMSYDSGRSVAVYFFSRK